MPEPPRLVGSLERLLHLKRNPMLSSLPSAELAVIADHAQERFFARGSVLLREGEPVGGVYFVVEGSLVVDRRGAFLARVGPRDGVGGLGLFARDPDGAQVVAESDTLTLELDADTVLEVFEDRFTILHHILRHTSRRLIELIGQLRLDPTQGSPDCRLCFEGNRELDLVDRIFFLRQMPVFERSSINALAELSRELTQVSFAPGISLWREGDPAPGLYLLLGGEVLATSERRGLRFRVGPGFPLGALEALAETPRWYDAVTGAPTVALHGGAEMLIDVFEDNFEIAMDYLAVLAREVLRIQEAHALPSEAPAAKL